MMTYEKLQKYLESRLIEWADWFRWFDYGLGYPHCTNEYRLWRDGFLLRTKGVPTIPTNDNAEEIEQWVVQLGRYRPELSRALREKYFSDHALPLSKIAQKSGVSLRTFEARVQSAKMWLMGKLG